MMIAEEANAIQAAYRCIDLVAPQAQPHLRAQLELYVDSRPEVYHRLPDMKAATPAIARVKRLHTEIWAEAIAASRLPSVDSIRVSG